MSPYVWACPWSRLHINACLFDSGPQAIKVSPFAESATVKNSRFENYYTLHTTGKACIEINAEYAGDDGVDVSGAQCLILQCTENVLSATTSTHLICDDVASHHQRRPLPSDQFTLKNNAREEHGDTDREQVRSEPNTMHIVR